MVTAAVALLFGFVLGSFYNVVIWRLPRGESIIYPASHCSSCQTQLQPVDLIPVLSFLMQRGRCRYCQRAISWQYPAVELMTATGFAIFAYYTSGWQILVGLTLFSLLFVGSVIDLQHKIIPNVLTLTGVVLGISFALFGIYIPIMDSLWGVVTGGGVLLLVSILSGGGMGMGDVKLLAMIGSFLGPMGSLISLFVGSLIGSIVGLVYLKVTNQDRKTVIPFGPFLSIGGLVSFWWILIR